MDWKPISTAPYTGDLEIAVIEKDGPPHAISFPCRRVVRGWIADTLAVVANAGKKNLDIHNPRPRTFRRVSSFGEPLFEYGRIVMEWFSKKTSIAGIQLPNWMVVLGAIIVILIIYTSIH